MTTIVSAFIYLENNKNRPLEEDLESGSKLLVLKQNKIIFIDERLYDRLKHFENDNTVFIKTKIDDLYLYKEKERLGQITINTDKVKKDTFEYFTLICNKTEWVKEAINMNIFNSEQYIWIDFCIPRLLPNGFPTDFKPYDGVRIANIWDLNCVYYGDVYKDVYWYFAGGVFGGNKKDLIVFADLMKEKCIELIEKQNHIMWEVNIWYLIWKDNKDLFLPYNCDHNQSIIDNY